MIEDNYLYSQKRQPKYSIRQQNIL